MTTRTDQTSQAHLSAAAAAVRAMLRDADAGQFSAPTPCRDWDLGALTQHFVGTTTGLAKVGRREELGTDPWAGPRVAAEDWRPVLARNLERLAEAWSADAAWAGTVTVGREMPAKVLGDMAYAETLLHGWDIARALGAELVVSPEMAAVLLAGVEETAELGRQMEAYGPAVAVPEGADDFQRALGVAGRDPHWTG
jgi:uncharacterized protein (TIGR03086 family)